MSTSRPLMIFTGSSSSEDLPALPRYSLSEGNYFEYNIDIHRHHAMLSGVTPSFRDAIPLMFIKTRPTVRQSSGTSQGIGSEAAKRRYAELATQLEQLDVSGDDVVEHGTVETAAAVIKQFSQTNLAPPELSWMGSEAIVMLWMLGSTKYALTITEGEVGYVVRADGKTLRRDHGIPLEKLGSGPINWIPSGSLI